MIITGEYATGSIRSTLAAATQRGAILAARAGVFAVVWAMAGLASSFAAFHLGQALLASKGIQTHLADPGVLRSVIGAGRYMPVLGLLMLGLGTLIRRMAGAIAAVVGVARQAIIGRTKFTPAGHPLPLGRASRCFADTWSQSCARQRWYLTAEIPNTQ
jgi:hypothetical protein